MEFAKQPRLFMTTAPIAKTKDKKATVLGGPHIYSKYQRADTLPLCNDVFN